MLEWKIEIIGYKDETISENKWSRHYERLYKTCEKDNPDVTNALFAYKDFNESVGERYIYREALIELLNEPNRYNCKSNPEITKKVIPYLKDYEDFLVCEV